jgi:hypothetical protein
MWGKILCEAQNSSKETLEMLQNAYGTEKNELRYSVSMVEALCRQNQKGA